MRPGSHRRPKPDTSRAGAAASGSSTRRSTHSRRAAIGTRRSTTSPAPPRRPRAGSTSTPDQGSDLPRADGYHRRQAGRAGGAGGGAGDRARRPGGGGDPHGAHDVRRAPDDGAAAVPRHDGRGARVPGGDERPPRAVRGPDPGLPRRRRCGRGAVPPLDTRLTAIAWFGAINEVVARWLLADDPAGSRTHTRPLRARCSVRPACPRRGSRWWRCHAPRTAWTSRRRR